MATLTRTAFDYSAAADHSEYINATGIDLSLSVNGSSGLGQSFTGNGNVLESVSFYGSVSGPGSGYLEARIYAHTGTYGTSSRGTGSPLAVSEQRTMGSLPTSSDWVKFRFTGSNRITLTVGTKYVAVVYNVNASTVTYWYFSSNNFLSGNRCSIIFNTFSAAADDFAIQVETAATSVNVIPFVKRTASGSGAGTQNADGLGIRVITASGFGVGTQTAIKITKHFRTVTGSGSGTQTARWVLRKPILRKATGSGVGTQTAAQNKPLTTFQPPANDTFPWADYRQTTPNHELFGYVKQGFRAQNIYRLIDGTFTTVDPLNPNVVQKVYLGGHRNKVDAEEIAALVAAGYGAGIS